MSDVREAIVPAPPALTADDRRELDRLLADLMLPNFTTRERDIAITVAQAAFALRPLRAEVWQSEIRVALAALREWMTNDDLEVVEMICEQVEPALARAIGCKCVAHDHETCPACVPQLTEGAPASTTRRVYDCAICRGTHPVEVPCPLHAAGADERAK